MAASSCRREPIVYPDAPWLAWQDDPVIMDRMTRLGLAGTAGLLDHRSHDTAQLTADLQGERISTDDHPVVDYINLLENRFQALMW